MNTKTIKIKKTNPFYLQDCQRIQNALIDKGLYATFDQCDQLWRLYSEDYYSAGWVSMSDMTNQEICDAVRNYYEVDNIA